MEGASYLILLKQRGSFSNKLNPYRVDLSELGLKEVAEISKPRIVVLLVITAITSMYAESALNGLELD